MAQKSNISPTPKPWGEGAPVVGELYSFPKIIEAGSLYGEEKTIKQQQKTEKEIVRSFKTARLVHIDNGEFFFVGRKVIPNKNGGLINNKRKYFFTIEAKELEKMVSLKN